MPSRMKNIGQVQELKPKTRKYIVDFMIFDITLNLKFYLTNTLPKNYDQLDNNLL